MLGVHDAAHAENGAASQNYVIVPVSCPVADRAAGAPKLSGASRVCIRRGSLLGDIYQREEAAEEYFCNYEVNTRYQERLEKAGLRLSAFGENGEVRAVELPRHRFFLATLFLPQLAKAQPHPVIMAYLEAALRTPAAA